MKIYSHPRSGTNYLVALIAQNLYPGKDLSTQDGYVGHWNDRAFVKGNPYGKLFGGHGLASNRYKDLSNEDVYIYRDGRDVALSLWNSEHFTNPEWKKKMTFSEFLRIPLDWIGSPGNKLRVNERHHTIFSHWKMHLELWAKTDVKLICYEELCKDCKPHIQGIAKSLGITIKQPKQIKKRAGWFPSQHNGWKQLFTKDDIAYFYEVVGDCYGIYDK